MRLSMGLMLPDGTEYYIPQGVFYLRDPKDVFEPSRREIQLSLVDKWAYLDGTLHGSLDGIYEIPINSNIFNVIQSILALDRGNGVPVDSVTPLFTNYYDDRMVTLPDGTVIPYLNTPYTARMDGLSDTYASIVLEMNTMVAGLIGYNAFGQLQLDPSQDDVLDADKPVLWQFSTDEAEFLGATSSVRNTEVYNDIIVTGATILEKTAQARVSNYDVRSPYNVQTIGYKTKPRQETTSDQYTSDEQCLDLGRWLLKRHTIMQNSISISCAPMFHLHENGLVTLHRPDRGNAVERHLITGYTLPLGTGAMTVNATSENDIADLNTTPV
jgi:hypothetical protein